MFKTKNASKKRDIYDSRVTLDAKHNEKIEYFNSKYNSVNHKNNDLNDINVKLKIYESKLWFSLEFCLIASKSSAFSFIRRVVSSICNSRMRLRSLV